jgi:hypothetical protein
MPTDFMPFDEAFALASAPGVSSTHQRQLFRSWFAWVSKDRLHVTTTSKLAQSRVWHLKVEQNRGCRMFFKINHREAYCFSRPGPRNPIEAAAISLNACTRADQVTALDVELLESDRGTTERWWSIQTDGRVCPTPLQPSATPHPRERGRSLLDGERLMIVKGGTWAVQWMGLIPDRLVTTSAANQERIPTQIHAENALRWLTLTETWSPDDPLQLQAFVELSILLAQDALLAPQVETLQRLVARFQEQLPTWLKVVVGMEGCIPKVNGLSEEPAYSYPSEAVVQQLVALSKAS